MKFREAIKKLEATGFKFIRMGRGSHVIMQKGIHRIVLSVGEELSSGMTKKVRTYLRKVSDE